MSRGFRVNFSVPELGQALNQINAYDSRSRLGIENAVQGSTKAIATGMKSRVPVKSGKLKKRIKSRFSVNKFGKGVIQGEAAAVTPYAHLVEFGAKGTVIKPKNKKALRFVGDAGMLEGSGGQYGFKFAASVTIPARKAKPYARPAFEAEKPNLIRAIGEAVKK